MIDLKALRVKWANQPPLGRMAQDPTEVLALIDELEAARVALELAHKGTELTHAQNVEASR